MSAIKSTSAQAGAASARLLNSPLGHFIERVTICGEPGTAVTLSGTAGIICSVTCRDFTTAVNVSLDIAEGKKSDAPELLAENERLRARVAELEAGYRDAFAELERICNDEPIASCFRLRQKLDVHRDTIKGEKP